MEIRLCRFCLASKDTNTNPLISPCACKGSMQFVHFKCLNRWRSMNIERNGRTCSLCMTNYILPRLYQYEVIPNLDTWSLYIVHYPGLTLSFYHYFFIVIITSSYNPRTIQNMQVIYQGSQYIFHGLYALLVAHNWRVQNKNLYMAQLKTIWLFVLLALHGFLFILFQEHPHSIGPVMSFYLGIYWKMHTQMLKNINEVLLETEIVEG